MSTRIEISTSGGGVSTPVGATLMKTGQTTSYRTGDDGDIEAGRATDFFTLAVNNPFGNTNRFTDELGGSTYTNNILIDWSTYNGSTVLGYDITKRGTNTWSDAIDNALALTVGSYSSGWRLWNMREADNLRNFSLNRVLEWSPFSDSTNDDYWTSTTTPFSASNAYRRKNQIFGFTNNTAKTNSLYWKAVRTFTVTGTTLT
jgi:hypothetical protein